MFYIYRVINTIYCLLEVRLSFWYVKEYVEGHQHGYAKGKSRGISKLINSSVKIIRAGCSLVCELV